MQLDHEDLAHGGRAEPPLGQHRPIRAPSMSGRPGELEFSHERHRDVVVLGVHGELDLATAPALARELHAAQKPVLSAWLSTSASLSSWTAAACMSSYGPAHARASAISGFRFGEDHVPCSACSS